jgi:DNA-binding transcriptional LysR family regulator
MAINELRSVSIFIKAAELGSLRKAALSLNLSPQAASKALAQLEKYLAVRLFHRTTFQPILWSLIEEFCERYPGIQPDVVSGKVLGQLAGTTAAPYVP